MIQSYEFLQEWRRGIPLQVPASSGLIPYFWNWERRKALSQLKSILGSEVANVAIREFDNQIANLRFSVQAPERTPPLYWLIARNAILVKWALVSLGHRFKNTPIVDTLPTAAINAITIKPQGLDQFFILFPQGVKYFASLFFNVVLKAEEYLPSEAKDFEYIPDALIIHMALNEKKDLIERFSHLIITYVRDGSPFAMDPFGPRPRDMWAAGRCKTGADLFLLAHEFAHVAAGHFAPHEPPQSGVVILTRAGEVEIPQWVRTNWDDEFEADSHAVHALLHLSSRLEGDPAEFYAGAYLLLCGLRALRQAVCILVNGNVQEAPIGSHPPIDTRLEIARKVALSAGAHQAVRRAQVLEYIVKYFSQELARSLVMAHVKGFRPAGSWHADQICQGDA